MENLLQYFMKETDRKFDSIDARFDKLDDKLDDLTKFKIEMVASARLTSFLVSAVCGAITLTISVWVALRAKQ